MLPVVGPGRGAIAITAQSKAATGISADPKATFEFWCAPADVEYRLAGNMPVITTER